MVYVQAYLTHKIRNLFKILSCFLAHDPLIPDDTNEKWFYLEQTCEFYWRNLVFGLDLQYRHRHEAGVGDGIQAFRHRPQSLLPGSPPGRELGHGPVLSLAHEFVQVLLIVPFVKLAVEGLLACHGRRGLLLEPYNQGVIPRREIGGYKEDSFFLIEAPEFHVGNQSGRNLMNIMKPEDAVFRPVITMGGDEKPHDEVGGVLGTRLSADPPVSHLCDTPCLDLLGHDFHSG